MEPPNIYIIGAQCTGKTTLVEALEKDFDQVHPDIVCRPAIIQEVARTVLKEYNFTSNDNRTPTRALELQRLILDGQFQSEQMALGGKETWIISDRSVIDPIVYARKYVSVEAAQSLMATEKWVQLRDRMAKSLVVVCEAGVDWLSDDGVRLMPLDRQEWMETHEEFLKVLREQRLEYLVLPRDLATTDIRVSLVVKHWMKRWSGHTTT